MTEGGLQAGETGAYKLSNKTREQQEILNKHKPTRN
jgi:hypothetical protein